MTDANPPCPPPPATAQVTSTDPELARRMLNRFYHPVSMATPDGTDGFRLDLHLIQLGPLTIGQVSFGSAVTFAAADLDGYHVTLPMVGRVHARQARFEVTAGPGTAALFRPGEPVYTRHDAGVVEVDVKITRAAMEGELATLLGRPVHGTVDFAPSIALEHGPGASWARLVRLLRTELNHAGSILLHPLMADQLRHSVISGLLLTVPHRYHEELTAPAPAGPPRALRRALDAIQAEPERPFSVADLAEIAGMSVRSLQEGFRRHVGCAPMAYLQEVRLGRVHESLRGADPTQLTVAAVAHRWGFAHLGRFASAYRMRFGQSPSETLRRLN
jgi:AraC-like DNA-binding protein